MNECPLVLIEWEDSRRPSSAWAFLADFQEQRPVKCVSVGWLLKDGDTKELAPNMGDVECGDNLQVSGVISIASRSVLSIKKLRETKTLFSSS